MSRYRMLAALLICTSTSIIHAQELIMMDSCDKAHEFTIGKLVVPATFITVGVLSLTSDAMKNLNGSTMYEISEHQPAHTKWDNYTQYAPAALVYALSVTGIKGMHNFADRTLIYTTSQLISAAVVLPLKHAIKEERPDGSNSLSFPSGHTATAFSSAQFMFREYHEKNFLLSISGYPFALFTGIYRTLNNKHWFGDVVAGAGIGIISTEAAYWLYPITGKLLKGKRNVHNRIVLPTYDNGTAGLTFVQSF